jgi:hypothetical protein
LFNKIETFGRFETFSPKRAISDSMPPLSDAIDPRRGVNKGYVARMDRLMADHF